MMKSAKGINNYRFPIFCVLIAFIIRIANLMVFNSVRGGDSESYLRMANMIMGEGPLYFIHHIDAPYYWGYPTFLAIIRGIAGDNDYMICLLQVVLGSMSMVFLYRSLHKLVKRPWVCIGLVFLYNIIYDVIMWDRYILTDSLGMTLEAICVSCYINLITDGENGKNITGKAYIPFFVSAFCYFITRSNAIVIIFAMCIVLIFRLGKKSRRRIGIAFAILMMCLVSMILIASFLNPQNINLLATFRVTANSIKSGSIIDARPEYDVLIPQGSLPIMVVTYVWVILKRIVMYWSVVLRSYSKSHALLSILGIIPTYALSVYSAIFAFKRQKRIYVELIFITLFSAIIQSIQLIDFDFRYRAPIFMLLILVSSLGCVNVAERFRRGTRNSLERDNDVG